MPSFSGGLVNIAGRIAAILLLLAITLPLYLHNLSLYTDKGADIALWFDEGANLKVPVALVQEGSYGIQEPDGLKLFPPDISTGPPVTLLIALVFRLVGIGLLQARLVIVLYAVLTIFVWSALVSSLFNWRVAVLATLLWLSGTLMNPFGDPSHPFDPVILGRYVLGEIPAFFFLLTGIHLWVQSLANRKRWLALATGICWGLAIMIKLVSALVLVAFAVWWIVDRLNEKRLRWRHLVLPVVGAMLPWLVWFLYQVSVLDLIGAFRNYRDLFFAVSSVSDRNAACLGCGSPIILERIRGLANLGFYIFGIPALLYGSLAVFREKEEFPRYSGRGLILTLTLIWNIWFVFFSAARPRWATIGLFLINIFVAAFLYDLTSGFVFSLRDLLSTPLGNERQIRSARHLCATLLIALLVFNPFKNLLKQITLATDSSPISTAAWIKAQDWGPDEELFILDAEISFLTNRPYKWISGPEMLPSEVHYVIYGPQGGQQISWGWLTKHAVLLRSIGKYSVFCLDPYCREQGVR